MTITLDTSAFEQLLYLPAGEVLWRLFFWYFGWLPVAIVALNGILHVWLHHRRHIWGSKQKYMLLAIDIPRNNAQSPRAVENMFIYFAGAHGTFTLIEKWWDGKFQLGFSFEIVAIDGFIQFLIHTPVAYRNLVETAVYSQYPDAEIYEVEDYVRTAPDRFPDEEYDIWGAEFIQVANPVLPIRTYPEFEHNFGEPETQYKDPMASLMDLMSSLQKGEQLWYQIVLVPIGQEWTKERDKFVAKILGEKPKATAANDFIDRIIAWIGEFSEQIYQLWGDISEKDKSADNAFAMLNIKPKDKLQLEAANLKAAKLGFDVSIRAIYLSRKEVMNKPKVVNGFVGYIKQFNTGDLNALKPDTKVTMTSAAYFRVDKRVSDKKRKIMQAYKERSDILGRQPWVMNVEELATLWHFPIDAVVKAPLVQRAGVRRIEPPMSLPFDLGQPKMAANREPIFDDNYEVYDPSDASDEALEGEPEQHYTAKKSTPGFMDDEEPSDAEALEDKGVSEKKLRGEAPDNLPFAD